MAYIELGIWPIKFWKLTLYEWTLCIARIKKQNEDRKRYEDLLIELERNHMAFLGNRTGGKEGKAPFLPTDFFKCSYDEINDEIKVTGELMYQLMTDRFKNIPLRRKRNG